MRNSNGASAPRAIEPTAIDGERFMLTAKSGGNYFAAIFRRLWGKKAPQALGVYTEAPTRTRERWASLEGDSAEISARALCGVLRGEEGDRVLDEILRGSNARWVRDRERGRLALEQLDRWKQLDLGIG